MYSPKWGFIITPEEIAENKMRRDSGKLAPDLKCPVCLGGGFIHPRYNGIVHYSKVINCPRCMCGITNIGGC